MENKSLYSGHVTTDLHP